jgi:hypothetical protein
MDPVLVVMVLVAVELADIELLLAHQVVVPVRLNLLYLYLLHKVTQ